MLYNKNNVRKTNDKKILHKVGKQWKVISVALLMAIGGGAVATHAVNADNTNANNANVAAPALSYAKSAAPTSAPASAASSASAKTSAFKPASVASNDPAFSAKTHGVSAASYNNEASNDKVAINGYVKSLNAKFPTAVNLANTMTASAKSAENYDKSMAASYSAVANASATKSAVSSLASKAGLLPDAYANYIGMNEQNYANAVKSANDVDNALNVMNSVANTLEGTNWSDAANVAASNSTSLSNKYYVLSNTAFNGSYGSKATSISNAATSNNNALNDAEIASNSAANAEAIAASNANSVVSDVDLVAKYLGVGTTAVNNAVNSANSSSATYNISGSALSNGTSSANSVSQSDAYNAMNFAVSNSSAMKNAEAKAVSANSAIASRKAQVAAYATAYSAANSASAKASSASADLSAANLAAAVANDATKYLNTNMTSSNSASMMNNLASAAKENNGKSAVAALMGISSASFSAVQNNRLAKLALASMASDEGVNVLALRNNASGVKSAVSVANSALSGKPMTLANLNSVKNSMVSAASAATLSAVNSSAAYAKSNNTSLVLASSFASSFASDASDEANSVSEIAAGLASFGNNNGLNASAYASAVADLGNAESLADQFAQGAYNNAPKYVTVEKQVALYNVANGKYSWVVNVPAGTRLTVNAVSIAKNGQLRYVTSYKGKKGTVNSYMSYVTPTYLTDQSGVDVKVVKNSKIYKTMDFSTSYTGKSYNAGKVLKNVNIVSPANGVYGGFTAVQLSNGEFVSANVAYAEVENNNSNNNSSVTPASQAPTYYFD